MTDTVAEGSMDCPLYDPYRRGDRFGLIGTDPMGIRDRLLFLFFTVLVLPVRVLVGMVWLLGCYLSCRMVQLLPSDWQPAVMAPLGRMFCHLTLMTMGILVETVNLGNAKTEAFPCAIVSNHVSWLDILVHMSHSFPSFVAATTVKNLAFVGKISEMMGCIYVERENKGEGYQVVYLDKYARGWSRLEKHKVLIKEFYCFQRSLHDMTALHSGIQGTTTNGQYLLKFKKGAFLAGLPVQPVVLLYSSHWVHPSWETISGPRHVRMMLSFPYARVPHHNHDSCPSPEECRDPERFAQNVRDYMITASHHPFLRSDATIIHKRQSVTIAFHHKQDCCRYQALLRSLLIDKTIKTD